MSHRDHHSAAPKHAPWYRSVRVRLAALMLVVAVPLLIMHAVHTASLLQDSRAAAGERVQQAAELMANRADDWIEGANAAFLSLADPVRRNWDDRARLDSLLGVASGTANQRLINFFVLDTLGRNRGSGRPTPDRDTINFRSSWWREPSANPMAPRTASSLPRCAWTR
ncbi:MAG: hypothetical protein MUD17_04570 [Gemmatimonadaceae bacterium]|nr:hypothetical protein [Gemmatimonadaceae bacterium]